VRLSRRSTIALAFLVGLLAMSACSERSEIIARQRSEPTSGAGGVPDEAQPGGAAGSGAGTERPRFGTPVVVSELSDPDAKDQDPSLTEDLLEIFFFTDRDGDEDIWTSRRSSRTASWEAPVPVEELNSGDAEQSPAISRDGLRILYYSRREPPGIFATQRPTRESPWDPPEPIPIQVDEPEGVVIAPSLDALELRMAVSVGTGESRDIYELVRPSLTGTWSEPSPIEGLNLDVTDSTPFLIDDGSELLFSSGRSGTGDLYWAHRTTPAQPVERVEALEELNDPDAFESHPHLAVDRSVVFFGSTRSGNTDIYEAPAR